MGVTAAAIIAAGSIAAAGISAYSSSEASKAAGASNKNLSDRIKAATDQYNANVAAITAAVNSIDTKIQIPEYTLLGTPDVYKTNKKTGEIIYNKKTGKPIIKKPAAASKVLEGIEAANKITLNTLLQLDAILPGANESRGRAMEDIAKWEQRLDDQYAQVQKAFPMIDAASKQYKEAGQLIKQQLPQLKEARDVAGKYLTGDLPDVTKRQISRAIAEFGGAGYNPASAGRTSGFQMPQGMLAENLAQAAEERQRFGLSAVSNITGQTSALAGAQANVAQGMTQAGLAYGQAGAASANLGEAARGLQSTNMAWQSLSQGFMQNTPQIMGIGLTGRAQDIDKRRIEMQAQLQQQQILANLASSGLAAQTGAAVNINQAQQSSIQSNLASQQATAQMLGSTIQGIGQMYGAYQSYNTPTNVTGYGGQQYTPQTSSTGGLYYAPTSGSINP